MKKIFVYTLLLTFCCCAENAPRQSYLKSDELIDMHFNKYQITDLEKLMAFFESEICGTVPSTPEEAITCYKAYGKLLADRSSFGNMDLKIPLEKQNRLLEEIRPVTFEAIWVKANDDANTTSNGLFGLKYGGQYANFLKHFAKENETIQQYVDVFDQAGIITPSMIANVLLDYEKFGIEDQRGRLALAIHYLTLNRMFAEAEALE
ncbi:MAG: hypothetical protein AB8F74_01475 [Saprospiraceae bacterium]